MKHINIIAIVWLSITLLLVESAFAAETQNQVCPHIGELTHGNQKKCAKGDLITINPMLAAYLCDLSKGHINGEKIIVCHYIGYKRHERK